MAAVPRAEFVSLRFADRAWDNHPLPIGFGQTISQPLVVALMIEFAGVAPGDHVLDVGTGSGYQAAVLAEIGCVVSGIEVVPELAAAAAQTLDRRATTPMWWPATDIRGARIWHPSTRSSWRPLLTRSPSASSNSCAARPTGAGVAVWWFPWQRAAGVRGRH